MMDNLGKWLCGSILVLFFIVFCLGLIKENTMIGDISEVTKIEIICNRGNISVFENGQPVGTWYQEYFPLDLPDDLDRYLRSILCKFPPGKGQLAEDREHNKK